METEVLEAEMVLPTHFRFKKIQMYEKYPKGQSRGRHWKHLKQIIQAENYQNYPMNEPNCEFTLNYHKHKAHKPKFAKRRDGYRLSSIFERLSEAELAWFAILYLLNYWSNDVNVESPPSMRPCKRICDITGFEAPYFDPRTKLRYANAEVFKIIRALPNDYVQRYLTLRNAAIVLK